MRYPPERIVCLTEETVETLYLIGEQDRIVGVSGYAVRPPQVRKEKPRISAFTSAHTRSASQRDAPLRLFRGVGRPIDFRHRLGVGADRHCRWHRCLHRTQPAQDGDRAHRLARRAAKPDVILASWCGKKVRPERIAARAGWDAIPAVAHNRIHEIKSPLILQPGPAALTDGLDAIVEALGPY